MSRLSNSLAVLWGFAEATFFFLVPDIWASISGRTRLRSGLIACLFAVCGALVGGAVMYVWGHHDQQAAATLVEKIPAISPSMMERARTELNEEGALALFTGPLRVTPYKIYAIYSSEAGIGLGAFMMVSFASRLLRFISITTFCHFALKLLPVLGIRLNPLHVLLFFWGLFYLTYFALLPG